MRRFARPIDRVVMGFVMGVIVFVIERMVTRGTRGDLAKDKKEQGAPGPRVSL